MHNLILSGGTNVFSMASLGTDVPWPGGHAYTTVGQPTTAATGRALSRRAEAAAAGAFTGRWEADLPGGVPAAAQGYWRRSPAMGSSRPTLPCRGHQAAQEAVYGPPAAVLGYGAEVAGRGVAAGERPGVGSTHCCGKPRACCLQRRRARHWSRPLPPPGCTRAPSPQRSSAGIHSRPSMRAPLPIEHCHRMAGHASAAGQRST